MFSIKIYFLSFKCVLNRFNRLGEIYLTGEFNLFDFSKAKKYFLKNIDLDSDDYASLYELGEIYLFGFGTEKNLELAEKYFSLAQASLLKIQNDPKRSDIWSPDVSERYLNRVNLTQVKDDKRLNHLALVKQSRLSVMPIDKKSWTIICNLGGIK